MSLAGHRNSRMERDRESANRLHHVVCVNRTRSPAERYDSLLMLPFYAAGGLQS